MGIVMVIDERERERDRERERERVDADANIIGYVRFDFLQF